MGVDFTETKYLFTASLYCLVESYLVDIPSHLHFI